jgi:hypothetical protein
MPRKLADFTDQIPKVPNTYDFIETDIRKIFGDNIPTKCPACGAEIMAVGQNRKTSRDAQTGEIMQGDLESTIEFWCGSTFSLCRSRRKKVD